MKQLYIYQEKNDPEIWQNIRKGNENAFSIVFQHYYSQIFNYGLKLTNDPELIKDVIQELFINIWNSRKKLGLIQSIKIYLLISFRRSLIRKIQKQKKIRQKQDLIGQDLSNEPSHEDLLISKSHHKFQLKNLREQISQLSSRQQEVIHLKFYHGLENQDIKEIMMISHQSVRNLLHEAIKKLKVQLDATSSGIS